MAVRIGEPSVTTSPWDLEGSMSICILASTGLGASAVAPGLDPSGRPFEVKQDIHGDKGQSGQPALIFRAC